MCYTRRKIEGGVGALRESDDTNFLKPNGQSRNLNIYGCKPLQAKYFFKMYRSVVTKNCNWFQIYVQGSSKKLHQLWTLAGHVNVKTLADIDYTKCHLWLTWILLTHE